MLLRIFVIIPLALQYISCAIEDSTWSIDATYNPYERVLDYDSDSFSNETNVTTALPIIDFGGLRLETDDGEDSVTTAYDGQKLISLFLNAYCANNNDLTICITYNRCKNKDTCDTLLSKNEDYIYTLMREVVSMDDAHKLIELTDKVHDWTKFALISAVVVLKLIISYLLERKFKLCGKLKTKINEKKKNSVYVIGDNECQSDDEEMKTIIPNPPAPLPVHAQATVSNEPVYDVPRITPPPIVMSSPAPTTFTPREDRSRAP